MEELVAGLYRAAAGIASWDEALGQVTALLGLMGCQMVGVSASNGAFLFSHAALGGQSEAALEYVRTYHSVDPRIPLLLSSAPGDWLYDEDVFGDEIAITSPYYRELLIPFGARYTASAKLLENDGEIVLLAFLARLGAEGFTSVRRQALTTIGFHLRQCAAIYQKTRRSLIKSLAGTELLARLGRPAYLLAVDRSVSLMNAAAQARLEGGQVLSLRRGRLEAQDGKAERAFSLAFDKLVRGMQSGKTAKREIVRLPARSDAHSCTASLTAFVPAQTMYAFGDLPQVLLLIHDRAHRLVPDVLLWEAAYGLTPGQSRVALEVFQGRTVKEAAARLVIAESTARTHLNEVFAKTNTARQAQLVLALAALEA